MTTSPVREKTRLPNQPLRSLSLRTRLVLGSLSIVVMAIGIMGAYVYYRITQTNTILTGQLDRSILQQAETTLNTTADQHASTLTNFFGSFDADTLALRSTSQNLLAEQATLGSGAYWDAHTALFRNIEGSWDNSNAEAGSVFIPAALEITDALASELNTLKNMDAVAPAMRDLNPDTVAVYYGSASGFTLYYPNIDLAAIVPPDFDVTGRPWYVKAAPEQNPGKGAVWSEPYLDAALNGIVITNSAPVFDKAGRLRGVVAQDIQLRRITGIVTDIRVGETGYAFLVDKDYRLIAMPDLAYQDLRLDPQKIPLGNSLTAADLNESDAELFEILSKMASGESGLARIHIGGTERFVVYRPIGGADFGLAIIVPVQEMLAESEAAREQLARDTSNTVFVSVFVILGILALTSIVTLNFGNNLTAPLVRLTRAAQELAKGNLNARVDVKERNEIGALASTLNSMASELKDSIDTLETRVAERTAALQERSRELEAAHRQVQQRAAQFEALAQVSQAITSIRNLQELLPHITNVISERFGFYHVGIFLLDEFNEYAVLSAANSEGGRKMLERKHRLRVGEQGIVGTVTATGQPRLAMDVGEDAVFFSNPELPDTHSEMALPLRSSNRIIGALDVQSTEIAAFTEEDIQTLGLLADQVSLAIENARLFEETRRALSEAQAVSRQVTREAWEHLPEEQNLVGYRYSATGAAPLDSPIELPVNGDGAGQTRPGEAVFPIELRGGTIGTLVVHASPDTKWTQDQLDLIKAVAERVALSAENARLFEETTRRAQRERLVSEITTKIRSNTDPEEMIRTAVEELRRALRATRVEILPQNPAPPPNK